MRRLAWLLPFAIGTFAFFTVVSTARANPSRGEMRFSLDTDLLGIAGVDVKGNGRRGDEETSVFTVGTAVAPVSLGFGWALSEHTLFGGRVGFGFQKNNPEYAPSIRLATFSLTPHFTFLPMGDDTKLYIEVGPILRIQHWQAGRADETSLAGGAGAALGLLVFTSHNASIDIGFFFDATFGEVTRDLGWFGEPEDRDARVLRGGVRLGVSIWGD